MSRQLSPSFFFSILAIWLFFLAGCASTPFTGPVPEGTTLSQLPLFDNETPVVWHPSGQSINASQKGLIRYDLRTGDKAQIDSERPARMVWSPDSTRLAAAYRLDESTRIVLRDAAGKQLAETILPGILDRLLWSEEVGLLVITSRLKIYSFGGDLRLTMHLWDGVSAPQSTVLYNATIRPSTSLDWEQGLIAGSEASLSPDQDEILYLQLHDPPAFQGSYYLTLRHLKTGAEKKIVSLPIGLRSIQFIDSDHVLVDNGNVGSMDLFLWGDEANLGLPFAGKITAVSPGGHYRLIGEQLLLDKNPIGHFPGVSAAAFSPDGSRLLLQIKKRWYLLDGLTESVRPTLSTSDLEKLRQLRNWRSRGLITPQEFLNQKSRITQP
jgi:hypothetical protein